MSGVYLPTHLACLQQAFSASVLFLASVPYNTYLGMQPHNTVESSLIAALSNQTNGRRYRDFMAAKKAYGATFLAIFSSFSIVLPPFLKP